MSTTSIKHQNTNDGLFDEYTFGSADSAAAKVPSCSLANLLALMVGTPAYSSPRSPSLVVPSGEVLPKRNSAVLDCHASTFEFMSDKILKCSAALLCRNLSCLLQEMSHLYILSKVSGSIDGPRQHFEQIRVIEHE